jgi:5-methylcytosine-specific restriction protein A
MPFRPPVPCREAGCAALVVGGGRCPDHAKERRRAHDRARGSAAKRGYGYRWQKARAAFLAAHPLCASHEAAGRVEPANEVHHLIAATGPDDPQFWDPDNWQALCHDCHSAITAQEGGRWSGSPARLTWPADLQPSAVPLTIVCGPPGSGKTRYVAAHAAAGDTVIDLDAIKAELSGLPWYRAGEGWLEPALRRRNALLRGLAAPKEQAGGAANAAWFIVGAPRAVERRRWRRMLGAAEVVVLEVQPLVCAARLKADDRRDDLADKYARLAAAWWEQYAGADGETVIYD